MDGCRLSEWDMDKLMTQNNYDGLVSRTLPIILCLLSIHYTLSSFNSNN